MQTLQPNLFRFCLLPSSNPPRSTSSLHNETYQLWKSVWQDTFEKLGVDTTHLLDDFIRQDLIAGIYYDDKPVAVHLYSFFSIDSLAARDHRYLNENFPELYFQKLRRLNVRDVMSMEYMTVHPDWRKGKSPVHIGAVLVALAVQVMKEFGADGAIAPARRDHKVQDLAYAVGGEPVIANVMNHNVPCDLLLCHHEKLCPHPVEDVRNLANLLWEKREYSPACEPKPADNVISMQRGLQAA